MEEPQEGCLGVWRWMWCSQTAINLREGAFLLRGLELKFKSFSTVHVAFSPQFPCSCHVLLALVFNLLHAYVLCSLPSLKVLEDTACTLHLFEPFDSG